METQSLESLDKKIVELSDKLSEGENILQDSILDYSARNELDKEGYAIRREGLSKLQITNEDTVFNFGHGIKKVYYFSVSNKNNPIYLKMFSSLVCKMKTYSTKLEFLGIGGKKEWHIGINSSHQPYGSLSGPYNEVRRKMLECARDYRKNREL